MWPESDDDPYWLHLNCPVGLVVEHGWIEFIRTPFEAQLERKRHARKDCGGKTGTTQVERNRP